MGSEGEALLTVVGRTAPDVARVDVVRLIEQALAEAKRGELLSVAIACVTTEQEARTAWSRCDNHILLAGAVRRLEHRIQMGFE